MGGLVIDDGGSTRIKWMGKESGAKIAGIMHGIMSVQPDGRGKNKSSHGIRNEPYTNIRIMQLFKLADPAKQDFPFPKGAILHVFSHLGQRVEVENTGKGLSISLSGDPIEPVVEARQHDMKRRYIVTNSGQIEKIDIDYGGGNKKLPYDIANYKLPKDQPIYTCVVLT